MENKEIFQTIIPDYEAARPGYPDALFADIAAFATLDHTAKILEIGAGPGQATEFFVQQGYDVTALEISQKQVQYLSNKFAAFPRFHSVCSKFEEFQGEPESYDLIYAATSFHWIEPEEGYEKAFRLLKNRGIVAVFWHMASIVEPRTELQRQIRTIYYKHAPQLDDYLTEAEAEELHQQRLIQIQTKNLFDSPVSRIYRWQDAYYTQRYLQLMNSYSDFHSINSTTRNAILRDVSTLIDRAGGTILIPQEVRLYMAQKNARVCF